MDVARLNFSHGTHQEHARAAAHVRAAAEDAGRAVAVLADLQGPKIRLGTFVDGAVTWNAGDRVVITTEPVAGTRERVSTTYAGLAGDLRAGDSVLVDDGNIALEVERVTGVDVVCRVVQGGPVSDHKGVSLPGVRISAPAVTDKDVVDLRFAVSLGVDSIGLSFVRSPADGARVREILGEEGSDLSVIAKIETPQAVGDLAAIIDTFDGIMVARGDLGVEIPLEEVPVVQRRAIRLARRAAKPVIVATQMLESMLRNPRPTRAEASDVAHAVFDGADAVMLSGETSVGQHPVAAVDTMRRILGAAEGGVDDGLPAPDAAAHTGSASLAAAAATVATQVQARAVVAFTESGATARRLARRRPPVPLMAFTPHPVVRNQLAMSWGVEAFVTPRVDSTDEMLHQVDTEVQRLGRADAGDLVVVLAGAPAGRSGSTSLIQVRRVGG